MEAGSELKKFDASQGPRIVPPDGGKLVELGSIGARMMAWAEETGGGILGARAPHASAGPRGAASQALA